MKFRSMMALAAISALLAVLTIPAPQADAETPTAELAAMCEGLYGDTFGIPNTEPLGACQWDMALINAGTESYQHATGAGVMVGVLDSGIDFNHPDLAPNIDVELSCSFIFDDDPLAADVEKANRDCSNKTAVQDLDGHGTHVATTIAAPVNGIGIAGVAPDATIVGVKVCSIAGYCFAPSVAAGRHDQYVRFRRVGVLRQLEWAIPWHHHHRCWRPIRVSERHIHVVATCRWSSGSDRRTAPELEPGRGSGRIAEYCDEARLSG